MEYILYINFNTHVVQSFPAETLNATEKVTCSDNVAYDTVSSALRISSQDKVTTSENIDYATVRDARDSHMGSTTTIATLSCVRKSN